MHIYTDLAAELRELSSDESGIEEETVQKGNIEIKRIRILNDVAAKHIGKKKGTYITLDSHELETRTKEVFEETTKLIAEEIRSLLNISSSSTILVVGLGNRGVTPDSLGPEVVSKVHITRHIKQYMPEALEGDVPASCAIAPGVLGITGVETMDVVKGVVESVKPDAIIAIDALASRRAARISSTVQLCDSGISPGSGVGNSRSELSQESLGIPVIAIGVPMVVYASTIIWDTISLIADENGSEYDEDELKQLVESMVKKQSGDMIVTPKDIDTIVDDMAGIIAGGINLALFGEQQSETLSALLS